MAYQSIQSIIEITDEGEDSLSDLFHDIFSTDESIMETMAAREPPWDDLHYHYYFVADSQCLILDMSQPSLMFYQKEI